MKPVSYISEGCGVQSSASRPCDMKLTSEASVVALVPVVMLQAKANRLLLFGSLSISFIHAPSEAEACHSFVDPFIVIYRSLIAVLRRDGPTTSVRGLGVPRQERVATGKTSQYCSYTAFQLFHLPQILHGRYQ